MDQNNFYRSKNPDLFKPKKQGGNDFVREQLTFLSPLKVKSGREKDSVLDNEDNLRRLKAVNYGKWYIKPEDYNKKIKKLNKKLDIYQRENQYF